MRKKKHISDLPKEAKMVYELLSKINWLFNVYSLEENAVTYIVICPSWN